MRKRDGGGIPGAQVRVSPLRAGAPMFGPEMTPTGPDGSFVVEHVPAGRARVTLMSRSA